MKRREVIGVIVLLSCLFGCAHHYHSCVVVAVETQLAPNELTETPTVVRAEYRVWDAPPPPTLTSPRPMMKNASAP